MLAGYNTDVAYEGVTYHVQTEDKGIDSPIILSLVYRGGTILAAKRTNYSELVSNGTVDEQKLAALLERQHRIIVAAIQAGKIEKLTRYSQASGRSGELLSTEGAASPVSPVPAPPPPVQKTLPQPSETAAAQSGALDFSLDRLLDGYLQPDEPREKLGIELLVPPRFVAGQQVAIRAAILFDGRRPADNATVKLQIVGTNIKPQNFMARADHHGIVNFKLTLPQFTSGTAAVILQASEPKGQEAEVKFLIRKR